MRLFRFLFSWLHRVDELLDEWSERCDLQYMVCKSIADDHTFISKEFENPGCRQSLSSARLLLKISKEKNRALDSSWFSPDETMVRFKELDKLAKKLKENPQDKNVFSEVQSSFLEIRPQ